MLKAQSGEMTISYTRSGTGPTLVLVAGGFSDHENFWVAVRPALEEHFTVVSIARRGYAESSRSDGHTVDDEGEDIAAVIKAVGGEVFLLGHSYGALCGLAAALRSPQVARLVLYEPPGPDFIIEAAQAPMREAAARGDWERVAELFVGEEMAAVIKPTPFFATLVKNAEPTFAASPDGMLYALDSERFRAVKVPTLLLKGSQTPDSRVATSILANVLPDSRVVVMEGQGHAAMLTAPALFVKEVEAFLLGS